MLKAIYALVGQRSTYVSFTTDTIVENGVYVNKQDGRTFYVLDQYSLEADFHQAQASFFVSQGGGEPEYATAVTYHELNRLRDAAVIEFLRLEGPRLKDYWVYECQPIQSVDFS